MNQFPENSSLPRVGLYLMKLTMLVGMGCLTILLSPFVGASQAQTVTTVYSFNGNNASQYPYGTPAQGRDARLYGTTIGEASGSLFRLAVNGSFDQLVALDTSEGANPYSGVTLASNGNFYGVTTFGGSAGVGVLFRVTPGGTYTVLHEFAGGSDGAYPYGPPIQASDGNLYGTTHGQPGASTVYKYTMSGVYSILSTFTGSQGIALVGPLVQGADGNLYGTAEEGGAFGYGTVFKMRTSGVVLGSYSFNGTGKGAYPTDGLTQGLDGNFYGTTSSGGKYSSGTIFKVTPQIAVSTLYTFQGSPGDGSFPEGLVQGTDGKLYGATAAGGVDGFGTLFQISSTGVYELLYSFQGETGEEPSGAPLQDTNGSFYGVAGGGGANGYGTMFSLSMGLGPFVTFVQPTGRTGQTAQILGQGLTGTTGVIFNGVAATSFSVLADTYLTAVVPSGATTGTVVVTTPGGTLTSNKNFQIISSTAN